MKKLILLLLTLILVTTALLGCATNTPNSTDSIGGSGGTNEELPEREYSDKAQVIILLGQSNASGCSNDYYLANYFNSKKLNEYRSGYKNVKMSYIADGNTSLDEFLPVKIGQANTVARFGPEIGISEKISEKDPSDRVFIIKYAYGGTRLTNQWCPPSAKGEANTGYLYSGAKHYILKQLGKLEEMGLKPKVKAICWMQGESDADPVAEGQTPPAVLYESYERAFINDLRADLVGYKPTGKKIGFVDAGISDSTPWVHYETVNAAKKKLADDDPTYHIYLDTIGAKLTYNLEPSGAADLYHYDSASMIKLGHMFAEALLENFIDA